MLKTKIEKKSAVVTVIGLGYVGLPMAMEFCKNGYKVNGLDTSEKRIAKLKKKESYINDISSGEIAKVFKTGRFSVTLDDSVLSASDAIVICVPTPLRKTYQPDVSYIVSVGKTLAKRVKRGQLIILESTTYPGTTREIILPMLEKNKLVLNKDFYLAFSPERIDPGNAKYDFTNIPKVVGGFTAESTELGRMLYSKVVKKVIGVSSPETAEVTKLLENTFRIVNIGLINEFANLCHKLEIDVWEVIRAAETKPFGFMPFYPGPGIGGHCIPADPIYLSWKARKIGFETKMIDLAALVNREMPGHIVDRTEQMLKSRGKKIKGAKVFIMGVTYKKDVNDLRESPALEIIENLEKKKAKIAYYDPYIPYLDLYKIKGCSVAPKPDILKKQDIVIVVTDHSNVDYGSIAKHSRIVFDTRNVFERKGIRSGNVIKL